MRAIAFGVAGVIGLYSAKQYFNGATCNVRRDLTGQLAIITGANTGIGRETALALAREHCSIIIAARDVKKCQEAVDYVKQNSNNNSVEYRQLDLASRQSIDKFAEEVKEKYSKVNILVNNAGVSAFPELTLNKDGIEMTMAVNHFGHFYLTSQLWPVLKSADDLRIVNVSSKSHMRNRFSSDGINFDFEDLAGKKDYKRFRQYSRSKLANVLFTQELAERVAKLNSQARVVSLHPGVVRTEIAREVLVGWAKYAVILLSPLLYLYTKDCTQGAQTTLYTVFEKSENLKNGGYYDECELAGVNAFAKEPSNQKLLWSKTEEMLGIKFPAE